MQEGCHSTVDISGSRLKFRKLHKELKKKDVAELEFLSFKMKNSKMKPTEGFE